jgi:DNA-binding Lrp family transcriptional regulator
MRRPPLSSASPRTSYWRGSSRCASGARCGVPEERILELGPRMSSFRGISHCYQRPTYDDWPYSVFTMAHGRSKEECDAILDSIADDTGIEDRRTLYSSTEFKKIRLRYFTDEHKRWEAEHS